MTAWTRVNILAEGYSEVEYIKLALAPHLATLQLEVSPIPVMTSRKHNKRGGVTRYAKVKKEIELLCKSQPDAYVSTMFDLFRLPTDFPDHSACVKLASAAAKAECLERAFADDIAQGRFIPYVQLHEFEALLYCDLDVLSPRIEGSSAGVDALKNEVAGLEPEDVNGGAASSPSKRIIKHIPSYARNKRRVGGPAAAAIPLALAREKCPHFAAWLGRLESLAS